MAPATPSSNPALRAIAAPRSQRSCSISRCSRRPRMPERDEPAHAGAAAARCRGCVRIVKAAYESIERSMVAWRRLASMSSAPKIRVIAAAFEEHPASLRNAAKKRAPRSAALETRGRPRGASRGSTSAARDPGSCPSVRSSAVERAASRRAGRDRLAIEDAQVRPTRLDERRGQGRRRGRAVEIADGEAIRESGHGSRGSRRAVARSIVSGSCRGQPVTLQSPVVRVAETGGTGWFGGDEPPYFV